MNLHRTPRPAIDVHVVHNDDAGDGTLRRRDLDDALALHGYRQVGGTVASVRDAAREGALIVVAGGDGTIRSTFEALRGSSARIAILPIGTANNIASTLGLDIDDPLGSIARWHDADEVRFDVAVVESDDGATFMVESTGGGLFAQLMQQAEVRPADLDLATSRALLRELAAHVPSTLWNIELDGVDLSGEYVAVCLMNIRYIGPRVCIAPDADPSDGLLDLVLLGPKDLQELCETLGDGPSANGGAPERTSHRGVRAVLLAAEHVPMAVDDELVPHGAHRPRRVTASDSTVRVLVPRPPIGVTR